MRRDGGLGRGGGGFEREMVVNLGFSSLAFTHMLHTSRGFGSEACLQLQMVCLNSSMSSMICIMHLEPQVLHSQC